MATSEEKPTVIICMHPFPKLTYSVYQTTLQNNPTKQPYKTTLQMPPLYYYYVVPQMCPL